MIFDKPSRMTVLMSQATSKRGTKVTFMVASQEEVDKVSREADLYRKKFAELEIPDVYLGKFYKHQKNRELILKGIRPELPEERRAKHLQLLQQVIYGGVRQLPPESKSNPEGSPDNSSPDNSSPDNNGSGLSAQQLGKIVATPRILQDLRPNDLSHLLCRHRSGDWGTVGHLNQTQVTERELAQGAAATDQTAKLNLISLTKQQGGVHSIFSLNGTEIWIKTQLNQQTNVFLADEY